MIETCSALDSQDDSLSIPPPTSAVLRERLNRMGLTHLMPTLERGWTAVDLFPWWGFRVLDPHFLNGPFGDVTNLVAQGFFEVETRETDRPSDADPLALIYSQLPLGDGADVGRTLGRFALSQSDLNDACRAALWAVSYLERRGDPRLDGLFLETARQALRHGRPGDTATARTVGLLARRHPQHLAELADLLLQAGSEDAAHALELPGFLVSLGDHGQAALERLASRPSSWRQAETKAALDACLDGDFDSLAGFLESEDWNIRAAAARTVGLAGRSGRHAAAALELLLARAQEEDDRDTRAVLSEGIGGAVVQLGAPGRDAVLETIREHFDSGRAAFLFDALLMAGGAGADPAELERFRHVRGHRRDSHNRALNRLLAWIPGYPVALTDWTSPFIFRSLQWADLPLPPAVSGWFSCRPTVAFDHVAAIIVRSDDDRQAVNYLAAQCLRQRPAELTPVVETFATHALNLGAEKRYAHLCALLAGSAGEVSLHPAELRAGLGHKVGRPLEADWAAAGRLLAIARRSLPQAQDALALLGAMGPHFQELARYALATDPEPERSAQAEKALPRRSFPGASLVGGAPIRLEAPSGFADELQPIFELLPNAWKSEAGKLRGLLVTATHGVDWSSRLAKWNDSVTRAAIIAAGDTATLQRAILAAGGCDDDDLQRLAATLAAEVPPTVLEGPLGVLVRLWKDRQADGEAAGTPADGDENDFDLDDLEALFND